MSPGADTSLSILMVGVGRAVSTFIQRQMDALRQLGVEVSVMPEFATYRALHATLCRSGYTFHLPLQMKDALRRADLVHYQWPSHLLAYGCMAERFRKPFVLSLRGRQINIVPVMPGQSAYTQELKQWLPRCRGYHAVSEAILTEAEPFGLVRCRAKVIRPAVDPGFFTPPADPLPRSPLQIVMVGALIWRKGYEYALIAFRRLLEGLSDARLVIVGDGDEKERVLYAARDLDVVENVTFTGRLDPTGVRQVLWKSHIFLHASLSEGIANVALEAMACGLPVVSTDAGGMREAITDGVDGFLVPLRDTEAMANRLALLVGDAGLRTRIGRAARDRVVQDFDLQDQGRKFVELYREVLGRHENCVP